MSSRPADEAAVLRQIKPSRTVMYDRVYAAVLLDLIDDGFVEDICDAIAENPKALRAINRRAKELAPWCPNPPAGGAEQVTMKKGTDDRQ